MRPESIDELVGQSHLLSPGSPLNRLIAGDSAASVILFGPPGTGKTTIASLISKATNRNYIALSALSSGVKEIREVIDNARSQLVLGRQTVLFIDEVHRFSKNQQDALLSAVENAVVFLVAATTENPSFSIVAPLLSRSLVLQLKPISSTDIKILLERALIDKRGLKGQVRISDLALDYIINLAGGDARKALTILESSAQSKITQKASVENKSGKPSLLPEITVEDVESNVDEALVRYDRQGDQHYDVISAFIKSIRGSDPDAAIHYLARMINAGEDPRFIARRLIILASEDIGLSDPGALNLAVSAANTVQLIGMPEARLALAEATIYLALAPKSNAVIKAIDRAQDEIKKGTIGSVPAHLRDGHYMGAKKLGNSIGYQYPHNFPEGIVSQQYPPQNLVGKNYYLPTKRGFESNLSERLEKIRGIVRGYFTRKQ